MKSFQNILFATDFSEGAEEAFDYAHALAQSCKGTITLLHVISEPLDLRGFYVPHISFDNLEQEIESGAWKMMEKFCARKFQSGEKYNTVVVPGVPHEQVIKTAEENRSDVIVIGTHGRTGLDHVLFGSVAEKIVRKSPVPVLTIPLEEERK